MKHFKNKVVKVYEITRPSKRWYVGHTEDAKLQGQFFLQTLKSQPKNELCLKLSMNL